MAKCIKNGRASQILQLANQFKFVRCEEHRGVSSKSKRVIDLESNVAVHLGERAVL